MKKTLIPNISKNEKLNRRRFLNRITLATLGLSVFSKPTLKLYSYPQTQSSDFVKKGVSEINLPPVEIGEDKTLLDALQNRKSDRLFDYSKELSLQDLSNLLWAAYGVNRPSIKGRTAPCAYSRMETDIYVALKQGLYKYEPINHKLLLSIEEDIRSFTGTQTFVKKTPVNLIYVADLEKMGAEYRTVEFWAAANCGFIGQNVYLYCAVSGLNSVIRSTFDYKQLRIKMNLNKSKYCVLTQSVGYPKN